MVAAFVGNDLAELGFEPECRPAWRARIQVLLDLVAAIIGQLAVEVVVKPFDCMAAVDTWFAGAHSESSFLIDAYRAGSPVPTSPRAVAYSTNAFCSAFLPRWILLITVPMGTPVIS